MRRHTCFKSNKRAKHVKADICSNCGNTILFCLSCLRRMQVFAQKYYQQCYGRGEIFCRDCACSILDMDDIMDERFGGNYLDTGERSAARAVLFG